MDSGKLQQFDTPLNIYQRPGNKFVAGFMGSPSMNFLDGRMDHAERKFVSQGLALDVGSETLSRLHGCESVTLGVRPEDVRLSVTEFAGGIPAGIYVTEALGNETFASLNLGRGKIIARTDPAVRLDMEAKVWVSFDETKFHFFDAASGNRLQ
jgi:ABC-type sugar transport system ATPase subunit